MACEYGANNKLIPLAFAIVEKEDASNWGWFMRWLWREVIGVGKFMCHFRSPQINQMGV